MMKTIRLKQMEQFILERDVVTVDELCEHFQIHKNTARSDINALAEQGIIEKRYGSVVAVHSTIPVPFTDRIGKNTQSKERIGVEAAKLLEEGDIIYIDSGTTVTKLLQEGNHLPKQLSVITNNLYVINWCVRNSDYTVLSMSGKVDKKLSCFASLETIESVKGYHIQKAFIGVRGITPKGDLTSGSSIDARIKSSVIERSSMRILMASADKMESSAMFNYSHLSEFDYWVTDKFTDEMRALVQKTDCKLL